MARRSRDAVSTIKGYYYQFDYFVLQLLNLQNNTDTVRIEGIEDVDVLTFGEVKAIQCKYYEGTICTPSLIGGAVRPMLMHFAEHKDDPVKYTYRLFGHFKEGQESIPDTITVDYLKNRLLTYTKDKLKHETHVELGLTDKDLAVFIKRMEFVLNAKVYEDQVEEIITKLQTVLHCTDFESRYFYYNNSVSFVKEIAVKRSISARTVTKESFLKTIGTKKALFDQWYIEYVGFEKYYKAARKEYFTHTNISFKNRFFLIECNEVISNTDLAATIMQISDKWSKLSKREQNPFCPFIYLHGLTAQRLAEVKHLLLDNDFHIWDGYEYQDAEFSASSLVRPVNYHIGIRAKIINQIEHISDVLDACNGVREVYQFYFQKPFFNEQKYINYEFQIRMTNDVLKII